jgi:hypothetical protein
LATLQGPPLQQAGRRPTARHRDENTLTCADAELLLVSYATTVITFAPRSAVRLFQSVEYGAWVSVASSTPLA